MQGSCGHKGYKCGDCGFFICQTGHCINSDHRCPPTYQTAIGQTAIDAEKDATIARLTAELEAARRALTDTPEAAANRMIAHIDGVRVADIEPSEQRKKYQTIAAQISVGKASQEDAVRAIMQLCRDNERLAVMAGKHKARAKTAEAEIARLRALIAAPGDDLPWRMLRLAAETFCARVENGEIRSKRSYSAFKDALNALPDAKGE